MLVELDHRFMELYPFDKSSIITLSPQLSHNSKHVYS